MVSATVASTLASSSLLSCLSRETLSQLGAAAQRHRYERGQIIFHQGDPGETLHVLAHGRVKVTYMGESGSQAVLAILGPGDCFGELSLLDGEPRSATVEALEDIETVALWRKEFIQVLRTNEGALDQLLKLLARRLRQTSRGLADFAFLDLEGRLAKKLLELATEYGRQIDGAIEIDLRLTQEDLAAMVGSTRTSVNRAISSYENRGLIRRRGRRLLILDQERLRHRIT